MFRTPFAVPSLLHRVHQNPMRALKSRPPDRAQPLTINSPSTRAPIKTNTHETSHIIYSVCVCVPYRGILDEREKHTHDETRPITHHNHGAFVPISHIARCHITIYIVGCGQRPKGRRTILHKNRKKRGACVLLSARAMLSTRARVKWGGYDL